MQRWVCVRSLPFIPSLPPIFQPFRTYVEVLERAAPEWREPDAKHRSNVSVDGVLDDAILKAVRSFVDEGRGTPRKRFTVRKRSRVLLVGYLGIPERPRHVPVLDLFV